jgi:hypothetical protein
MNIHRLSRAHAEEVYLSKAIHEGNKPEPSDQYKSDRLRERLLRLHSRYDDYKEYQFDYRFALDLYEILNVGNPKEFTLSLAADYDFWRFLSLDVVPDLVWYRHGSQSEYYYSKDVRIYLSTMWWYAHMSWQGSREKTEQVMMNNSTDTILNLVERPGRGGVHLDVYREIMRLYSYLDKSERTLEMSGMDGSSTVKVDLFRKVMVLHTAKTQVMNPDLHLCGARCYAEMLFRSVGARIGGEHDE